MANKNEWWRGAVVYQIYPRSFMDSNGDGIGDLAGITEKLSYVADLGVDAIWLSPFFKSPMKDFGYDVSDYKAVDPIFGHLSDFEGMLGRAHELGLKIIIDQVLNHTSDQHQWFQESRMSRDNAKADWYVWADAKPDGSPPNNWQAVFGGPSWHFEARRGQYYLHNFLPEQPDLNLVNPEVRAAVLDECRFWLEMGVDGFRLDTSNYFFHDTKLRDNPPNPKPESINVHMAHPVPFTMQLHKYDKSQPENVTMLQEIRALMDRYPDRMTVGEVGDESMGMELSAFYTGGGDKLHTCYNFDLLGGDKPSAKRIRTALESFDSYKIKDSWPSWAFSNHDVPRVLSRMGRECHDDPRLASTMLTALCALRGTIFIYQGEELGLMDAVIPYDRIQDPWGKYLYPLWQGRDGCRTPMPWTDQKDYAGFTSGEPWLPIPSEHSERAVKVQDKDEGSPLNACRAFLRWRKTVPALVSGEIEFIKTPTDLQFGFIRRLGGNAVLCLFNFDEQESRIALPKGWKASDGGVYPSQRNGKADGSAIAMPAFGIYCAAGGV
jgi:alpha-glucosidase